MKNIFKLMLVSLIFTACEDADTVIYDGSQNNPTFLSFPSAAIDFPVARTVGSNLTLTLNSSTVSNVDRVYNIEVNEEESTADAAMYDLPSTITIPAGSYQGTVVVQGHDVNLDATPQTVVFSVTDLQGASMDDQEITLNLFEVCPLTAPFTGDYTVEQITSGLNIAAGGAEIFGDDNGANLPVITLEMGASEYERTITADVYPEAGAGFTTEFKFRLTCDGINLGSISDVGVGCGAGNTLKFGPGTVAGLIDHGDDSVIVLRLTEDQTGSCATARQVVLQLTKVD
jgi:hypothetical protein